MPIAGIAEALSPTGDPAAGLSVSGGAKPMTAYSLRLHSGSGLSGKPPSEPFKVLKRATRFIISSRLHLRMSRQSLMFVLRRRNVIFVAGERGFVPCGTLMHMATKILVVDDNPDLGLTLKMALELEGYKAELATTGAQALALQRQSPASVVITDIFMPDSDGF